MTNHKKYLIAVLTTFFWLALFYLIIISHYNYSPLNISKKITKDFFYIAPQGWSFFTKNPRLKRYNVYKLKNKQPSKITYQNFSFQNFYGLSRKNRQILTEVMINQNIIQTDSIWIKSKKNIISYHNNIKKIYVVKNDFTYPFLCGNYIIERYEPTPWAWYQNKKFQKTKEYIKLQFVCK